MSAQKSDKESGPNTLLRPRLSWIYIILLGVLALMWLTQGSSVAEITWKDFEREMLAGGDVEKLDVINAERVEVHILEDRLSKARYKDIADKYKNNPKGPHYFFTIGSVEVFNDNLALAEKGVAEADRVAVTYSKQQNWWGTIFAWLLPLGLLFLFWMFLLRGSGRGAGGTASMFNFGRSKARVLEKGSKSLVTFDDVAGLEEAKEEIYEMVKFLKDPSRYERLGARIPKGILLVGPPGTGKTLLAKAVAGEAGVPFFSLSGSEFIEMFVGVGAARMRDLFQQAKAKAPSIIFIDEIDTIGRARGKVGAFQSNDERESTLNQFLAEMDGFDTGTGVIVLAATNRGDILDPALLRPGRFDRHIHLELPGMGEREAIFKVHMRRIVLADDVEARHMAEQTPGFSGADIANICNEAALIAARQEKDAVYRADFRAAIDRVVGGLEKKSKLISPAEKQRVAYHEAGHVTASWFLAHAPSVLKVSIIPRGRSLGAAWFLPEEQQIVTKSQFVDTICAALGGRAAEDLVFGEVSSNALDDLERVTKQAYAMVVSYGLSDAVRNISYYDSTGRMEQSLHKPYSEKTAQLIDEEVQRIVDGAYESTLTILRDHREELVALAEALMEKEIVYKDEIEQIFGARREAPAVLNG